MILLEVVGLGLAALGACCMAFRSLGEPDARVFGPIEERKQL